ncbi:MAG: VOC family protein [Mariniphaga sp.]
MERLISWVEIPAEDFDRAVEFYSTILATEFKTEEKGKEKKAYFPTGEGVIFSTPGFKPSKNGVIINFDVGNRLDETIEKIQQNGGFITRAKTQIKAEGQDYFALFIDSEGNRLGLNGR